MSALSEFTINERTRQEQARASDPQASAWVSANAGSGKTYVLAQRVVRLLLAGTDPSRILCLTFTKAAAAEMSNRVFKTLGEWTTLDDDALAKAIGATENRKPNAVALRRARTLFARALETPGGLKIQTIHAFCEALLHQFPLEANIAGHFEIIQDTSQKALMTEARRQMILLARSGERADLAKAMSDILAFASDDAIEKALDIVVGQRDEIVSWLREVGGAEAAVELTKEHFGFRENEAADNIVNSALTAMSLSDATLADIADGATAAGGSTNDKFAKAVSDALDATGPATKFSALKRAFLTKSFTPLKTIVTKAVAVGNADALQDCAVHLMNVRYRLNLLDLIEGTGALLELADAMIDRYDSLKKQRGLLDFDDLVVKTANLLTRSKAAQWVQYKLDRGIDHVLVDEAQDTSPRQWQVVTSLVSEFFAGKGSRDTERTVFAVGDEKQSIFSFQGAEPAAFSHQRRTFSEAAKNAGENFEQVRLNLSFRSTDDVLGAVDRVFSISENSAGLTTDDDYQPHGSARRNQPGTVDIWPLISAQENPEPEEWHKPVDHLGKSHQAVRLAERIAATVKEWLVSGERLEGTGKAVLPGDILVLVRSRDQFVTALSRALKERNVPVAGTDRLKLTDHIAIQDLLALGRVVLLPEDDLSLAALLRSPLVGMSEDALFELAHRRGKRSLFSALRENAKKGGETGNVLEWLNDLRARADQVPVYEFYAHLLGPGRGRRKFYTRLGNEAEDVIDAFLLQTLDYEQTGLPGLQAFVESLATAEPEIKREMDAKRDEVRVMTVHSAKGLEAPVVFLVDKCNPPMSGQHQPKLFEWQGKAEDERGYLWVPSADNRTPETELLLDMEKQAAAAEYRRLLYVGMTRAADRLIICGHHGIRKLADGYWHQMVSNALAEDWIEYRNTDETIDFWRWRKDPSARPIADIKESEEQAPPTETSSDWISRKLPPEPLVPRPLTPSGAQALIDQSTLRGNLPESLLEPAAKRERSLELAMKRGSVVHRLLQSLPELPVEERKAAGRRYLEVSLQQTGEDDREKLLREILAVIGAPETAAWFAPENSRAEVPVMGRLELAHGERMVSGQIDRLAVLDDLVVLIDFKTNRQVPARLEDTPPDYLTQMALYRSLIARIYPEKDIEVVLIWTHAPGGPNIMRLTDTILDPAFDSLAKL